MNHLPTCYPCQVCGYVASNLKLYLASKKNWHLSRCIILGSRFDLELITALLSNFRFLPWPLHPSDLLPCWCMYLMTIGSNSICRIDLTLRCGITPAEATFPASNVMVFSGVVCTIMMMPVLFSHKCNRHASLEWNAKFSLIWWHGLLSDFRCSSNKCVAWMHHHGSTTHKGLQVLLCAALKRRRGSLELGCYGCAGRPERLIRAPAWHQKVNGKVGGQGWGNYPCIATHLVLLVQWLECWSSSPTSVDCRLVRKAGVIMGSLLWLGKVTPKIHPSSKPCSPMQK